MWGIRRPRPQVGLLRLPGQWCIGGDGDGGGRLDSGSCYCCSSEHHLHHHSRLLDCEGEEEEEGRRQHRTWGRTRKPCRIASSFPESKCEDPKLSNHTQHLSVTSGTVSEEHEKSRSSCFRSRRCHLTREDIEKCSPGDKEEQCCEKQKREMDDAVSVQGGDNDSELPRNPWKILSVAIHTSPPGRFSSSGIPAVCLVYREIYTRTHIGEKGDRSVHDGVSSPAIQFFAHSPSPTRQSVLFRTCFTTFKRTLDSRCCNSHSSSSARLVCFTEGQAFHLYIYTYA